jgi:hypothetical protein
MQMLLGVQDMQVTTLIRLATCLQQDMQERIWCGFSIIL